MRVMAPEEMESLIRLLSDDGYEVVGPTRREGAIVYDRLQGLNDLPAGWGDEHGPGHYRLHQRDDQALFGYVVGPHSWKKYLFPPRETLVRVLRREDGGFETQPGEPAPPRRAFIGVRPCELAAIGIQDRVFLEQSVRDRAYGARREGVFLVAVNCAEPGGTCFCTSMGTGPRAHAGFDLGLTEVIGVGMHFLVIEAGSEAGEAMLVRLDHRDASEAERAAAERIWQEAPKHMGRTMPGDAREVLAGALEHPRWAQTAERCLSCANCTLVCPTCFCAQMEELPDLEGNASERVRLWDSCFNGEHSYMIGGPHRSTVAARYRQWLTHKLSTWHTQFGSSGCVGCGRCITWCPVGIDITEEVAAIRATAQGKAGGQGT
ncbi:4Fe-4S ferredoxin, iron-sulfur binding [Thioalkalivibrio sulfidiphilus HL-EbGr7]|uniref:4Fe-4S ferredoxin, iron-sulfur binding n=2 Tax=Thioalkalivibrio TaxID=106633 RepID=B8GPQ3_THISH|nr:sulfite reductase subunit A [Thioalkalivibrio sulfidiphilus]ACL72220.1 4Fe-4S ferredoxin, iron-sulfur binding [Thioalkalivibrio sulfidiphilus HL-EbGr7]